MVYCGRLSLVADLLQGLFKEAYALHKGLLEVLDKISLDSRASDEEVSDIVTGVAACWCLLPCVSVCVLHTLGWESCTLRISLHTKSLRLFNKVLMCCSNPQSAGYLLSYFQPGHCSACKHLEVPHQVGFYCVLLVL